MAALAAWRIDPTGYREDLAAAVHGHSRCNQRTAGEVCLDDDGAKRHPCDDSVANRKALFVRTAIEWELCNHSSIIRNVFEQFSILRRENNVDAGAEHGDGSTLGA